MCVTDRHDMTLAVKSGVKPQYNQPTNRSPDGKYGFRGFMTGFIPLSSLAIISTMAMWESSQWLRQSIVRSTGKKKKKHGMHVYMHWPHGKIEITLKAALNNIQYRFLQAPA